MVDQIESPTDSVASPAEDINATNALIGDLEILLDKVDRIARGDHEETKKRSKPGLSTGSRTRLAESEEDKRLLQETCKDESAPGVWLTRQPSCIEGGEMRNYQLEGLNWLISLYDRNINGILADEMGLGKTLQSISLVGYLKFHRGDPGPYLVVCPKSTVTNWMREFARWCPSLSVLKLQGDQDERKKTLDVDMHAPFDVVITTYEVLIIEKTALRKRDWRYMIIDEAHRIKNENSVLSQAVRLLNTKFRILITGTPLQNNLHELWALLNFLLPKLFSDSNVFDTLFANQTHSEEVVHKLHAILRPFILRRLKADVEKGLPPKKETKLYVPMTPLQRQLYASILAKDVEALNSLGRTERSRLINMLMQLRKACNHPYLFNGIEPGPPYLEGNHIWESCGKMLLLHKLLLRLKAEGHRVLIFTQMTRMMDILEDYCRFTHLEYCRLDGSTNGIIRDEHIDAFNAPGSEKFVFLLSTRAGGLGVNLQTADTVIIYDSDWNPQMDLQAQDRAHRVGQTKQVRVFRFMTANSVEEKIVERADKKLYLDAVVIQQGRLVEGGGTKLAASELQQMVRFGADEVFKSNSTQVTDVDIEAILADGEKRTEELKARIQSNMQHTLQNFAFDGTSSSEATYMRLSADEVLAAESAASLSAAAPFVVELGKRERTVRGAAAVDSTGQADMPKEPKYPKVPVLFDYQFWSKARIEDVVARETELLVEIFQVESKLFQVELRDEKNRKQGKIIPMDGKGMTEEMSIVAQIGELRSKLVDTAMEKEAVIRSAFPTWTRKDFKYFVLAVERYGKTQPERVCQEVNLKTGKKTDEIARYWEVFFARMSELENFDQLVVRFDRSEIRNAKREIYNDLIKCKIARYSLPAEAIAFEGLRRIGDSFTDTEDRGIFLLLAKVGYGYWDQLKEEVNEAPLFRTNWFIRTRTPQELQARCERLIRCVERETAPAVVDEKIPACWYDGNTSDEGDSRMSKLGSNPIVIKRKRKSAVKHEKQEESAQQDESVKQDESAQRDEPMRDEFIMDEPIRDVPIMDEPIMDEPILDEPVMDEPILDEPIMDEPILAEPIMDEPITKDEPMGQM